MKPIHLLFITIIIFAVACSPPAENGGDAGTEQEDAGSGADVATDDANDGGAGYDDPFTVDAFDDVRISSSGEAEHYRRASATVDFGEPPFEEVVLKTQLDTTCFPFESWEDNPPPQGHNYPEDCDAFDRLYQYTLNEPESDGDPPALELIRAITPFGGPLTIEQDITDVVNGLGGGEHTLHVFISTSSDPNGQVSGANGGWNVTASVEVTPGPAPREVVGVVPLYDGRYEFNDGVVSSPFDVPEETSRVEVEYRVTGHGGAMVDDDNCIGPAEEFCERNHFPAVAGRSRGPILAWRDDCEELCTIEHQGPADGGFDYCAENPTGAIRSVRAPRANWCPGDVTPPFELTADGVEAGTHEFEFSVNDVKEGGHWRVNAVLFLYE